MSQIPAGPSATGMVRVGREEWGAESVDGTPLSEGTLVKIVEVVGTHVMVWPEDRPAPIEPPTRDPEKGISP